MRLAAHIAKFQTGVAEEAMWVQPEESEAEFWSSDASVDDFRRARDLASLRNAAAEDEERERPEGESVAA
jgi:hypothetical protein